MRTVFADDSEIAAKYVHRTGLHHLVAMAAVVFTDDGLASYAQAMRRVRGELRIPAGCELKWSPPAGSWLRSADGNAVRSLLRERMLHAAVAAGARSVTVVYDRLDTEPAAEVRDRVLTYLYDKVCVHLATSGGRAVMITDEPGGGAASRRQLLAAGRRLVEGGTAYTNPHRIGLPILPCPSDHLEHLQLADLVAGATTAAVAGNHHAVALLDRLAGLADRSRRGHIGGAGVTLWPPRLMDLYWWLFNEPVHVRRGRTIRLGPSGAQASWRTFQATAGI